MVDPACGIADIAMGILVVTVLVSALVAIILAVKDYRQIHEREGRRGKDNDAR